MAIVCILVLQKPRNSLKIERRQIKIKAIFNEVYSNKKRPISSFYIEIKFYY
jgi:hypothetical protein